MSSLKKYFPVSIEEKLYILSKYNKTEHDVLEGVLILKDWLKEQPHIPNIDDDIFLEICLFRNKFRIAKTKLKIDRYFTAKHIYRDIFETLDPLDKNIENVLNYTYTAVLPKLTPCHSRVLFAMLNLSNKEEVDFTAILKLLTIGLENLMIFDQADSVLFVLNGAGIPLTLISKMDFGLLATLIKIYNESFSSRVEAIHILKMSKSADFLIAIANPFIPVKIKDKIIFHTDSNNIFNYIPKDCLPQEIGGTGPAVKDLGIQQYQAVVAERDYITHRNKKRSYEHLRIRDGLLESDTFGCYGTFKKIDID